MGTSLRTIPLLAMYMCVSVFFSLWYAVQVIYCMCAILNHNSNFSLPYSQILYNQQSVEVQGNLKRKLITQLQPDTDYSFVLTSRGNIAGGLQQQVSIRTAPDLIKTKPSTHQAQGGKMTINLPNVQTTTRVRSVLRHNELNTQTGLDSGHWSTNRSCLLLAKRLFFF